MNQLNQLLEDLYALTCGNLGIILPEAPSDRSSIGRKDFSDNYVSLDKLKQHFAAKNRKPTANDALIAQSLETLEYLFPLVSSATFLTPTQLQETETLLVSTITLLGCMETPARKDMMRHVGNSFPDFTSVDDTGEIKISFLEKIITKMKQSESALLKEIHKLIEIYQIDAEVLLLRKNTSLLSEHNLALEKAKITNETLIKQLSETIQTSEKTITKIQDENRQLRATIERMEKEKPTLPQRYIPAQSRTTPATPNVNPLQQKEYDDYNNWVVNMFNSSQNNTTRSIFSHRPANNNPRPTIAPSPLRTMGETPPSKVSNNSMSWTASSAENKTASEPAQSCLNPCG